MTYAYERIDGERVEVHVAAAYRRLKADFEKRFAPKRLYIERNGGTRTYAEQVKLFTDRYQPQLTGGGAFNDVRWWNGTRYVRVSGAGTVAQPGTSNHEENGPSGPRSLDIGSTGGKGAGSFGTPEQAWLAAHIHEYGFENEGYAFNEAWHKKFVGKIGGPIEEDDMPTVEDILNARISVLDGEATVTVQEALSAAYNVAAGRYPKILRNGKTGSAVQELADVRSAVMPVHRPGDQWADANGDVSVRQEIASTRTSVMQIERQVAEILARLPQQSMEVTGPTIRKGV